MGRWDNRKGYIRPLAECFHCVHYKGSVLWKNGIHLSGSHRFQWCQKQSRQEKYPVQTEDGEQSSRSGPDEGGGVTDGFVRIRGIGFLFYRHLRMGFFKIIIQKGDMPDDAEPVCEDCKFICIAEMSVDVLLFGIRTGSRLRSINP